MLHAGVLSNKSTAFVDEASGSWNKAIERFNDHESSKMHHVAMSLKSSSTDIASQLHVQHKADQCFYWEMLM